MANVYVASNKIEVFPSGFRGTGYTQSLYTSEKNLTSLVGKISKHSDNNCFCIEDPDYPTYTIIGINGYVFRLLTSDIPNNVTTAYIKLRDTSSPDYGKVLDNINSTGNALDVNNVFYGLAFTSDSHSYSATEPCVTLASSKFRLSTDEIRNGQTTSGIDEMLTTDVLNITSNGSINLDNKIKMYATNGNIYTTGGIDVASNSGITVGHTGESEGNVSGLKLTSDSSLYGYINARRVTINSNDTSTNTVIDGTSIPRNKTLLTTEGGTITIPNTAGGLGIQAQSAGMLWLQSQNTYFYGENNNLYIQNDNTNGQVSIVSNGITKINNTIIPKNSTLATSTDITNEATARQNADTTLQNNIDLKFDKTGGTISGNVTISNGGLSLDGNITGSYNNKISIGDAGGIKFDSFKEGQTYYYTLPPESGTTSSSRHTVATREWVNNQSYASDNAVVHKTGNETIRGYKTFSYTITGDLNGNATQANPSTYIALNETSEGEFIVCNDIIKYAVVVVKYWCGDIEDSETDISCSIETYVINTPRIDGYFGSYRRGYGADAYCRFKLVQSTSPTSTYILVKSINHARIIGIFYS